jgi:MEKHLA domain
MPIDLTPRLIQHSQYLLNSFKTLTQQDLIDRSGSIEIQAQNLFNANFVIVSHNTELDPIFNYGNQAALDLWEFDWQQFTALPSRLSAEPLAQIHRDRLLLEVKNQGYIANYRSVRITRTGKRFWVENATIWNVTDDQGNGIGQAATFSKWKPIVES